MSSEVYSFMFKFNQLLRAGYDAHLDVNAHAGNAWVGLKLNLGQLLNNDSLLDQGFKKSSPSRCRRREKRSAERDQCQSMKDGITEEVGMVDNTSLIPGTDQVNSTQNVTQDINVDSDVTTSAEDVVFNDGLESDNKLLEVSNLDDVDTLIEPKLLDLHTNGVDASAESFSTEKNMSATENGGSHVAAEDRIIENQKPSVVIVHATAVIEDSPHRAFMQEELDSTVRFITNKEHLQRNIERIEYGEISSRETSGGKNKHVVDLRIMVKTANLWESARSYLWKHIGQDAWYRGNGSVINLIKIHQKG